MLPIRLLTACVLLCCNVATFAQTRFNTYNNARFNYSISYPVDLIPQGEATNGDGQRFTAKDGHAELTVYGGYNALNTTLKATYEEESTPAKHPGREITYKVLRPGWFVISGRENGRIFYRKTMLKGDTFKTFIFEYDESQKAVYDRITAAIAKSFKE